MHQVSPIDFEMPPNACDCHTHVFGPNQLFPFAARRAYTPGSASVLALRAMHEQLGISRVVIVQPSPYGTDNSCTLSALRIIGETARGVAVIDPDTSQQELREMHHSGIRGVRLNLQTAGVQDPTAAAEQLAATSMQIADLGWHIQLYTSLAMVAALGSAFKSLPVPVVLDHFAGAKAPLAEQDVEHRNNFGALLHLLQSGNVWVKLSAAHRISNAINCSDVGPIAKALIAANPDRTLWGSDWPHPGAKPNQARRPDVIEPFNVIDNAAALNRLNHWAGNPVTTEKILVNNAATLYQFR